MTQAPPKLDYARPLLHEKLSDQIPRSLWLRGFFWGLGTLGTLILGAFGLMMAGGIGRLVMGEVGVVVGIVFFILILLTVGWSLRQIRKRRAAIVLAYLEQAIRLNLPLPAMLRAAARSESGKLQKRLNQVVNLLEDGAPVETAIAQGVPEMPRREVDLIAAAGRLGRLPQILFRLAAEKRRVVGEDPSTAAFAKAYPVAMLVAMAAFVTVVMVFVVPKYVDIFQDFGIRLPAVTRFLMAWSREWGELAMLVICPGAVVFVSQVVKGVLVSRAPVAPKWLRRVMWYVPVVHGLERNRGMADACHALEAAVQAGWPLPQAIGQAMGLHLNPVLRDRLGRWKKAIETGGVNRHDGRGNRGPGQWTEDASAAARRAGLPAMFCGMVGSASGTHLAQTLGFLAAYYDTRVSRAAHLLQAARVPVLTLVFGGIVLVLVSALLVPVWSLSDHVARFIWEVRR